MQVKAFIAVCGVLALQAAVQATPSFALDARIAYDVASFDFAVMTSKPGENWVLIKAEPDQYTA